MDLTPSEYERVVAEIVSGICASAPNLADLEVSSGKENRILGASGYRHQIDISLRGQRRIYLVECKRLKRRVSVQSVMVLAGRVADIQNAYPGINVAGILVSRVGASRGAIVLATYFGIRFERVVSAQQFGFSIGNHFHAGLTSGLTFGDRVSATVIPAETSAVAPPSDAPDTI